MYSISNFKDKILSQTTQEEIYLHYLGITDFPKNMRLSNPFTDKDINPSLHLYYDNQILKYKGHNESDRNGDVFQFVADLKQMDCKREFAKVCIEIAKDLNIDLEINQNSTKPTQTGKKRILQTSNETIAKAKTSSKVLKITKREFTALDLEYWGKLGVAKAILEKYKVNSISDYSWNDNKPIYTKKEGVAFAYELDGQTKLYIPDQPGIGIKKNVLPAFKSGIFGFDELPKEAVDNIIICEGEKDTIVANSRGFNTVTFGSCTRTVLKAEIDLLQNRCKTLFICYDNDNAGQDGLLKITKSFPQIVPLQLPNSGVVGYDITDYFQEHSADDFQTLINSALENKKTVKDKKTYTQYELPNEISIAIEELIEDIEKYRMFMANHQIWIMQGDSKKHYFKSVSNFEIEIIQHMQDEKTPLKLVRIKNTFNQEHVFDIPSKELNTPGKFDDTITGFGNFLWFGTTKDFQTLRAYLFDKMGAGKKIDCLGWQKEHEIWIWNNKVNLCNGQFLEIDQNGIFEYKNKSFFVPSANVIYKDNPFKFESQKNVSVFKAVVPLEEYLIKLMEVHRKHSMIAFLFTIASIFQDFIVKEIKGFPILFLQGLTSSGKDQLANCCQSFFGKPQAAINLESKTSTAKAHIREFAQFSNIICQFSEYKPGDRETDGILKGLWDRNGYKRGTFDSGVATDTVPILSSLILTSNYFPDDEALITRLLWVDMNKNEFTRSEMEKYNELADMTSKGISSYSDEILNYRETFTQKFIEEYRKSKEIFYELIPNIPSRIGTNYSILTATFKVFKEILKFPFTQAEMMQYFQKCIESQMNKMKTASITNKWWDCMLIAIKTNNENKLEFEKDIKLEGNNLYFNFTNTYNKLQRQWYTQYKENIPNKLIIQEYIKKDKSFIDNKSSFRFGAGKDGANTSAYVVDVNQLPIAEEFYDAVSFISNLP